jgi:hypothetical protein
MEALLIAAALTCADGAWILSGLTTSSVDKSVKTELRLDVIQMMPDTCTPEQYNPAGRK